MFSIPLKDSGDFSVGASTKNLYLGLSVLFAYVFLDGDTAKSFALRSGARTATQKLSKLIHTVVDAIAFGKHLHLNKILDRVSRGKLLSEYGRHMIERLLKHGRTTDEVVAEILPTAAASVATQAQAMAQMLDVYLQEDHAKHWPEIRRCAYSEELADFRKLQKYALEACRLQPAAFGLLRTAEKGGTIQDGSREVQYEAGDLIYTDFVSAGRDPEKFSLNAEEIDPNRPLDDYLHHGLGPHACIGRRITEVSLAVQLGLFAKLKNLRRVPGQAGQLKYSTKLAGGNPGSIRVYMTEDWSKFWPFPTS